VDKCVVGITQSYESKAWLADSVKVQHHFLLMKFVFRNNYSSDLCLSVRKNQDFRMPYSYTYKIWHTIWSISISTLSCW